MGSPSASVPSMITSARSSLARMIEYGNGRDGGIYATSTWVLRT